MADNGRLTVGQKVSCIVLCPFCINGHKTGNQCSENNVMHFLFNLLRIKCLYMFRALLAHPQEALHKRHLLYCGRVTSVCCTRIRVELRPTPSLVQPTDITRKQYNKVVCVAPPEDEQVMLETCRDT
jgi:hypothetical protein